MVFDALTEENILYQFLSKLISLRNQYLVFRSMDYSIEWIEKDKNSLLIKKTYDNDELSILINNSDEKHSYTLKSINDIIELEPFSFLVLLNGNKIL